MTLIEVLKERKLLEKIGVTFIDDSNAEDFLSYHSLYEDALKTLAGFQHIGMHQGDELLFQVEDNKQFLVSFWACILGGIIPIPVSIGRNDEHRKKLFSIWGVLKRPYLFTSVRVLEKLGDFALSNDLELEFRNLSRRHVNTATIVMQTQTAQIYEASCDDIAFVQFSSGSTGQPKGVVLTHRNIIANLKAISLAADYSSEDIMLSWMPLTHDMGLIGFHLNPLWSKMNHYIMPTDLFIRRPALWLSKASEHKASILSSPNFGYRYLLTHCTNAELYEWNLSSVRILYNGAEPVSAQLCNEFLDFLAIYKLKRTAMCPVYGLAEATLAVSIPKIGSVLKSYSLERKQLNVGSKIVSADEGAAVFANVGMPVPACTVRITDGTNTPLGNAVVGHIQLKGDNVTSRYYNNERAMDKIVTEDGWLNTGDLGFLDDNSLCVVGRTKDVIFVNGQNYYPHDLERIAENVDGIALNKIAMAGFFNDISGKEDIIAFVFHRGSLEDFIPILLALRTAIRSRLGINLDRILPVKNIPRTTSGKLQRFRLIQKYRNGAFDYASTELDRLLNLNAIARSDSVIAKTMAERRILELWRRLLNNPDIGVTDKFFENGGTSLKAMEMCLLLTREFNVELPLDLLYEKQTVQNIAATIGILTSKPYVPIKRTTDRGPYPSSPAQRRLYYAWQLDKLSVAYNIPTAYKIMGKIDLYRLEEGIRQIIAAHSSLRSSFLLGSDMPLFTVNKNCGFSLEQITCTRGEIIEYLKSLVKPFDLERGVLYKIVLVKIDENECFLFVDFHHIVADGISVYHFIDELMCLYAGDNLRPCSIQYEDYALWEKGRRYPEQEAYWLRQLSGDLPVLDLPTDFQRPLIFSDKGEKIEFNLSCETTIRLHKLARQQQCSLQVLLLAIFKTMLFKYTGQNDIIVGVPVAGRNDPEIQHMQGMFVNNLALRSRINHEDSFSAFLQEEQSNFIGALRNQEYPFDDLVRKLVDTRDVSRNPLFDTMFVFQGMDEPASKCKDITLYRHFFDPGTTRFDLSMEVWASDDFIKYYLEYSVTLFKAETILQFSRHFENLVQQVLINVDESIGNISVLGVDEYDQQIQGFNNTNARFPEKMTVYELFEERALQMPENIAIDSSGMEITYNLLNGRASSIATFLKQKEIGRNDLIAVLLPRSEAFISSILGILKVGAAFLPIDLETPAERVKYMLRDSGCRFVITKNDICSIESIGVDDVPIIDVAEEVEYMNTEAIVSLGGNKPEDLAYVIYTSGTTGTPKGVKICHRSLVNYISWASKQYLMVDGPGAFPFFTSVAFDLTITSLFTPLITGNKIVVYEGNSRDLIISQVIRENKVNIIKLTPSHLSIIRDTVAISSDTAIRTLIVGGEALDTKLASDILEQFGGNIAIFNEYGPTEATVGCMIYQYIGEGGERARTRVPIGRPIQNSRIYLLNTSLQPVARGVKGEIYISGACLAIGYIGNDESNSKFMLSPFIVGENMYKTGDIGKHLPDGEIEFIGRVDMQVKISGYRIEPSEIENSLKCFKGISDAIVTVENIVGGQEILCAYCVTDLKNRQDFTDKDLRTYLSTKLPYYMIPVRFMILAHIPLNKNGKVDFDRLAGESVSINTEDECHPDVEMLALFLRVWKKILKPEHLSVTDNFFELGGDSIKAVQISACLLTEGIQVSVKDILTFHTISHILSHATITDCGPAYDQGIVSGVIELSPIESWFISRRMDVPHYYNQSILLKFNTSIDERILETVFLSLVKHHDGLRLNYEQGTNRLYYNPVHLNKLPKIGELSLDSLSGGYAQAVFTLLKSKFDLTGSLLIKPTIIHVKGEGDYLFITAHHLVMDGVSWRILLEDFYTVYMSLQGKTSVLLPQKTAALSMRKEALGDYVSAAEEAYWKQIESSSFSIPMDSMTDDWRTLNIERDEGFLGAMETSILLTEVYRIYRTDLQPLLMTALIGTVEKWSGHRICKVEMENHGRHFQSINVARTIGWFTAMYPMTFERIDGNLSAQINSIKERMKQVPNHGIGYGIMKYSGDQSGVTPDLTELRFNYLGQFDTELNNDLFSFTDIFTGNDSADINNMTCKIECNLMIVSGVLKMEISYNKKAHKASTIRWFREAFLEQLAVIIDHIRSEDEIYYTPSDFDSIQINQDELDALFG